MDALIAGVCRELIALMTTCGGWHCPVNSGAAVCIQNLCLCENSLWYNSSRRCDASSIRTIPLQRCLQNSECQVGTAPLREDCVSNRCLVQCQITSECRNVNARCLSGLCVCDYGMMMQARGCTGIEYMQPGVAGGILRTTPVPPTLGFWVYAAIIGGVLLGAALVLVVVHSILKTRPIDPNALQRLTVNPAQENPFAPTVIEPEFYNKPRRQTYITKLVEKRFNFSNRGEQEKADRRYLEELIQKFNREHPTLAARLNDPDMALSPTAQRSVIDVSSYKSMDRSVTSYSDRSQSEYSQQTWNSSHRSVSDNQLYTLTPESKKQVKWTESTRERWPTDSSLTENRVEAKIMPIEEDYEEESLSDGYQSYSQSEQMPRYQRTRRGGFFPMPEEELDTGVDRFEHRFSIVK